MGIVASQKAHDGEEGRTIETLRVSVVRERSPLSYSLAAPLDAAKTARALIGDDLDREVFGILLVNTRHQVTAMHVVSVGTLSGAFVHPREVFKAAILGNAAAIILFHNHPSGDPDPSREDRELTTRLIQAGRILGIDVLDHVILGDEARYYSFKEHGML
jgi:DNA repair protein RadC